MPQVTLMLGLAVLWGCEPQEPPFYDPLRFGRDGGGPSRRGDGGLADGGLPDGRSGGPGGDTCVLSYGDESEFCFELGLGIARLLSTSPVAFGQGRPERVGMNMYSGEGVWVLSQRELALFILDYDFGVVSIATDAMVRVYIAWPHDGSDSSPLEVGSHEVFVNSNVAVGTAGFACAEGVASSLEIVELEFDRGAQSVDGESIRYMEGRLRTTWPHLPVAPMTSRDLTLVFRYLNE